LDRALSSLNDPPHATPSRLFEGVAVMPSTVFVAQSDITRSVAILRNQVSGKPVKSGARNQAGFNGALPHLDQ
jgi:hypothetical protein